MTYISPHENRLQGIARALKAGESVSPVTVRSFLAWFFGAQRRGRWIVGYIRGQLETFSLRTVPDFEATYLGADITFELADPMSLEVADASDHEPAMESVIISDHAEIRVVPVPYDDPTYRISKLGAANRNPLSVKPDATLIEAATLMLANDFSQLPVMTTDREVKGIISWKTVGNRLVLGQTPQWVREVMEPHAEISADASLFTAIQVVVEHDYALVRAIDQRIAGIITTTDLSLQFQQLSEPFLLLGEIENHIRGLLGSAFSSHDLASAKAPGDEERTVETAADLTFGEYQRLLEESTNWEKLGLQLDRVVFVSQLGKVRTIRNDVMHFDPDGIEEADLNKLRDFAKFLRLLKKINFR